MIQFMRPSPIGGRLAALLLAGLALTLPGVAQTSQEGAEPLDNRSSRTHYAIEARVDGPSKTIEGLETLTWTNRSRDTVSDLWFHLYWNAFSNNYSTHLWEGRGSTRGRSFKDGEFGWQTLTSVQVEGEELLGSMRYRQPDDGREEDHTVVSVDLPRAVGPGETIEVRITWDAKIPRANRRTGHKGEFLFCAHWFPKLGVYEGGSGWNCHQFHNRTEFYGDFGTYDVTIDLPSEYEGKVGASGVQVGSPETYQDGEESRVKTRFVAPSRDDRERIDATGAPSLLHGFTWTADPRYIVERKTFRADKWAKDYAGEVKRTADALGRAPEDVDVRNVEMTLLMHPERKAQIDRHFEATEAALFFYGLWFGEYPYEHITIVDPAYGSSSGGMEYPTLFTCGTRLFTEREMHRPESVTVHEAGHQFWYGLVGNNEFEAAWLDEGFNSYTDSEALFRHYGPSRAATWYSGLPVWGERHAPLPGGGPLGDILTARRWKLPFLKFDAERDLRPTSLPLEPLAPSGFVDWWRDQPSLTFAQRYSDPRWGDRSGYMRQPDHDPVDTAAWLYSSGASYGTNSYRRPAVVLRSLAAVVGDEAFLRGMRHYSETWRYRHPYPDDFFQAFNEGAGVDVSWYFDDLFRGTGTVDWRVEVSQWTTPDEKGYFLDEEGNFQKREKAENGDKEPEESETEGEEVEDEKKDRIFEVMVRRQGELRLPLPIRVTFESGDPLDFVWTREMQAGKVWWRLPIEPRPEKIISVELDPERKYYLDLDMSNNQWFDEVDTIAPLRWGERVLTQYSHVLNWFARTGG
jgi:hypothetical protein